MYIMLEEELYELDWKCLKKNYELDWKFGRKHLDVDMRGGNLRELERFRERRREENEEDCK